MIIQRCQVSHIYPTIVLPWFTSGVLLHSFHERMDGCFVGWGQIISVLVISIALICLQLLAYGLDNRTAWIILSGYTACLAMGLERGWWMTYWQVDDLVGR